MYEEKDILVTGAGSLGSALVDHFLLSGAKKVRVLDNHEMQLVTLKEKHINHKRLRPFLGDVRDYSRIKRACEGVDIVIHTAAYKQIPMGEYDPREFYKVNVEGTQTIIDACLENDVPKCLFVSSDKACAPLNLYGKSKAMAEGLITAANFSSAKTRLFCVRYGNVLGSRGSIIPMWKEEIKATAPYVLLTDPKMTRFNISMTEALSFIDRALSIGRGGEIFIPKLKAYTVGDMLDAFIAVTGSNPEVKNISIRSGEKEHELLISEHEVRNALDIGSDYVIIPDEDTRRSFGLRYYFDKVEDFPLPRYSSLEVEKLSCQELQEILRREKLV